MKNYTFKPIVGTIYGQWTVVSTEIKSGGTLRNTNDRTSHWKVKCNCGHETFRSSSQLRNGKTKACKSCCKTVNNFNTYLERYYKGVKQRALDKNFQIDIDCGYLQEIWDRQNGKCAISGIDIELRAKWQKNFQTASLDRIDNTKGYIKGNVQWVHKDINNMKYTFTQDYFKYLCKKVTDYKI